MMRLFGVFRKVLLMPILASAVVLQIGSLLCDANLNECVLYKLTRPKSLGVFIVIILLAFAIGLKVGKSRRDVSGTLVNYLSFGIFVYSSLFLLVLLYI